MMLRNRNLNVQQQNGAAGAEKSKRKQGGAATTAVKATKRQAPQLVAIKQEIKEEPVAKRSKARSSAHLPVCQKLKIQKPKFSFLSKTGSLVKT